MTTPDRDSTSSDAGRGQTTGPGRTTGAHQVDENDPAVADPTSGSTADRTSGRLDPKTERNQVVARQKAEYGGMKLGSAFFGWLTATGTAVLLTALVAGAGAAIGLGNGVDAQDAAQNPQTVGIGGGIALLVVLFISYFVGGYVAGRMARFSGLKQGLGVWLWALIIAVAAAVVGVVAGAKFDLLAKVNGFPRIPLNEGTLTTAGIITAIGLAVVSLVGALLGGLAGMRYHRKIDRAGFDALGDR
jgi:hypothetical protein